MTTDAAQNPKRSARDAATEIARRLQAHGHLAYFAGGCVRDRLRGEEPKDFDVATDAVPARIHELFPRARGVGEAFGVMLVRQFGHTVEVTTFRSDGRYTDGRRPDEVRFGGPDEDAGRRDFTINGLFEDPLTGAVIDHVDGLHDLDRGVIRCIGDAASRLREDRLRMLRAVRFAARFGFAIEPDTAASIRSGAAHLEGVSRERIGQELRRMLADSGRVRAVELLQSLGLDAPALDEPHRSTTLPRLAALPTETSFVPALAAWLLDRTGEGTEAATSTLMRWSRALVLSNAEREGGRAALSALDRLHRWERLGTAERKRTAAGAGFADAMAILRAELASSAEAIADDVRELERTGLAPPPFVDGNDLLEVLGLPPGPAFKSILAQVYDAQLEGRVGSREAAIELARELSGRESQSGGNG
ncbi:MAG: CCA tRNA nucleotidyltransferase [Phycisphaerales bacterium]|nr:CCA tRNA nucleotidyltransferase [Phycisphaerales bacterium]